MAGCWWAGPLVFAALCLGKDRFEPNCEKYPQLCTDTSGYIVVLDAGSTGTRIHVFNYGYRELETQRFPLIVSPPLTLPSELAVATRKPGLSSFLHDKEGLVRQLGSLLQFAADALFLHKPDVDSKNVPLYLGATAGLRELKQEDQDKVMHAARRYLLTQKFFAVTRAEQVRILAGEEEGAFGWLALNQLRAEINPSPNTTIGAIDFGGASVQIAFVPQETSILANLFPMHFGGSVRGPIHLYSKSFNGFGSVTAFQRATRVLTANLKHGAKQEVRHPCLPKGLTWSVDYNEFGVSTNDTNPERKNGPLKMIGTGHSLGCLNLTGPLFDKDTPCLLPPCAMMGVYRPSLKGSKFVLFGKYQYLQQWEVLPLMQKGLPLLKALEMQLPRLCSMPLQTQVELFEDTAMRHGPTCWFATWIFAMLRDGLGFSTHGVPQLDVVPNCCDHTLGHATYEVNFFPYKVGRSSYMALSTNQLKLDSLEDILPQPSALEDIMPRSSVWCSVLSFSVGVLAASGGALLLGDRSRWQRVASGGTAPLLQDAPERP